MINLVYLKVNKQVKLNTELKIAYKELVYYNRSCLWPCRCRVICTL